MDILTLERNVQREIYKSLEGFFGDAKWIRHNVAVLSGRMFKSLKTHHHDI